MSKYSQLYQTNFKQTSLSQRPILYPQFCTILTNKIEEMNAKKLMFRAANLTHCSRAERVTSQYGRHWLQLCMTEALSSNLDQ